MWEAPMLRCSGHGVPRGGRAPLALCLLARQRPPAHAFPLIEAPASVRNLGNLK